MLKRGTICYLSTLGNKGFLYPDRNRRHIVTEDSEVDRLPWMMNDGLVPVLIKETSVVVWCRPEDIV
jgi:hypothetical protein